MSKLNSQSSVEQPFCSKASGKKLSGKKTGFAFCGDQNPWILQSKEEIGEACSFLKSYWCQQWQGKLIAEWHPRNQCLHKISCVCCELVKGPYGAKSLYQTGMISV